MKKVVSLLLVLCLIGSGCTARLRQTTDAQIVFDPIASLRGQGVSGKQVVPVEDQTSVNADNTRGWKGGKF